MEAVKERPPCLDGEDDGTVMLYLGCGTLAERNAAFEEFYRRHGPYMYNRVARWCRRTDGLLADADWFYHQVVLLVFEKAATYDPQCGDDSGAESANLRAWLGKVIENFLLTQLARVEPTVSLVLLEELGQEPFEVPWHEIEDDPISPRMALIVDALETLTEREQDVIRRLWLEKDWRRPNARLPANVTKQIADSLTTTPANLRQIFHRAMVKIRDYVDIEAKKRGLNHG